MAQIEGRVRVVTRDKLDGGLGLCRIDLDFIWSTEGFLCRGNNKSTLQAHSARIMQGRLEW